MSTVSNQIREAQTILDLSEQETATLFGISPASLHTWLSNADQSFAGAQVEALYNLAQFLDREIVRERISHIVRAPDVWLGNRTILQVIEADGPAPIHRYLTAVFAFRE